MRLLILFCLLFSTAMPAQEEIGSTLIPLNQNSFYLVCRGTQQKIGFIAEEFNTSDKFSTHVGIGIYENGRFLIFNVTNASLEESDLVQEALSAFTNLPDIRYLSLWECRSSKKELFKLKKILHSYTSRKITFDTDFSENNNKYYCSEFCATVLKTLNATSFSFSLLEKPLLPFYGNVLHRNVLKYYPVDFFQKNPKFHKVFEQFY